jgi:hypothetical protein
MIARALVSISLQLSVRVANCGPMYVSRKVDLWLIHVRPAPLSQDLDRISRNFLRPRRWRRSVRGTWFDHR